MTPLSRKRAVVFDFDGTLVNSLPLVLASIAHALEPFGRKPTMDIFAKLGGPPERFLPQLLDDPKHAPEALVRMDTYHQANNHLLELFAGVRDMLDSLRRARVRAAVWTGRDRLSTELLLNALSLEDAFDAVVCGDDLSTHKPDPAGLREILRRLGTSPEETLFVGDADVDVLGGCACGVETILIRHSRSVAEEIVAKSWRAVSSPDEAYALVAKCVSHC